MSAEKVGATPGPWMGSGSYVLAPDGFVAMVGCVHRDSLVCAANGALIAAAPDLLALAKRYAKECPGCRGTGVMLIWGENADHNDAWDHSEPCDACADIRAVIEKAEGGA